MTRLPDWQSRLNTFLLEHQHEPFRYGRFDCCLFVCEAISVMTGVDPAAGFRETYSSRAGARRALVLYCGAASVRSFAECFTARYGMRESAILHAQRGDVVLIKRSRDYSLGLVALNGREIIVATSEGLSSIPISSAVRAWHV